MIVICIEGCHGCGKSTLCKEFANLGGFEVLDEGFLDMPSYSLHPQTLVMETMWVSMWMERLLRVQKEHQAAFIEQGREAPERVFVADRSPYSAVYYAGKNGRLLDPLIRQSLVDLAESANIHVVTININVAEACLWDRIQQRLEREPEREKYNEHKRAWMEETNNWYKSRKWDLTIDNSSGSVDETLERLLHILAEGVQGFHGFCTTNPAVQLPESLSPSHPLRSPSMERMNTNLVAATESDFPTSPPRA
jgi:thymidylate kinase